MNQPKIIALVGMPGAGKGTCTSFIAESYSVPLFHFGNMVYEEVQRRGLDNVKDERFVREDMRRQEGLAVLAKHIAKKAQAALAEGHKGVVLDGLYSWSEYKYLHELFGDDFLVIAVVAPRLTRYERVVNRTDSHRTYTREQIEQREVEEIENLEKGGPIAMADHTLLNDDKGAMLANLKQLLDSLHFAA